MALTRVSGNLITSTAVTAGIYGGSGNTVNITVDAQGRVTAAANNTLPNTFGFKNRIINGDMRIDQRNAGANVTLTAGGVFSVDRFQGFEATDGAMTAQQDSSAPAGFVNSLKLTTTTADGSLSAGQYAVLNHIIEGTNVSDLAWGTANAKTITLSFWVRSSLTGTFGGGVSNSAENRSYPFTYSISVADTWEQKSVTIAGDTSGTWLTTTGVGLRLYFGLGVGSTFSGTAGAWAGSNLLSATGATSVIGILNATWYVTGVQLETGSTATSFDVRPYGTEFTLCQRYYQQFGSSAYPRIRGYGLASTETMATFPFPTTMRAAPTGTLAGTWTATNCSAPACGGTDTFGYETRTTVTTTAMFQYYCNGTTGNATFSAEL